ncbi:MAG: SLBB domain-containing protein, partial [Pseudomonadota bacterium]|nr:SLBB domain-containing protein [Pseudomonadota bacterium]
YVGEVEIRNLTQPAARAKIQEAMTEVAPEAQVQLAVQQGAGNAADLVGGVSAPGSYPLPSRNYSILSLIAAGGGISPGLENPLVRLLRGGHVYEIRAEQLMADPNLNTILRGGDKVVVAEDDRFFTALGATGREEVVPFTRESLTAMEALSTVGGLSDSRADLKSVLVLRDYPVDDTVPTPEGADYSAKGPLQEQVVFAFDLTSADGLFVARKFEINPKDTVLGTETVVTSARTVLGLI